MSDSSNLVHELNLESGILVDARSCSTGSRLDLDNLRDVVVYFWFCIFDMQFLLLKAAIL